MPDILLASASPRRRELLASLGFESRVVPQDIDETRFDHLLPGERVVALARAKAKSAYGAQEAKGTLIIAADTLVCNPDPASIPAGDFSDSSGAVTLGKPRDREEAGRMIRMLAGRAHTVYTGIAVIDATRELEEFALSTSMVRFCTLSGAELEGYLDSGEWEGVAGAYRIQGLAAVFIEEMRGSWSGIVGLPIRELYAILSRLSIQVPAL